MSATFMTRSHPEHAADVEAELVQLARNIRAWQERTSPRLSDEKLVRQYPALGSTKTYRRLHVGDTDGLVADNHLPNYRGVWLLIEQATGADGQEEIYIDLQPTMDSLLSAAALIPQKGRERLMLLEGETGSGKTTALESIAARYPGAAALFEATEAWISANAMVCGMLVALGVFTDPTSDGESKMPTAFAERLQALINHLRAKRRILLLDEGHHIGPSGLNVIKAILNQTDVVIIVAAIPTLWAKLTKRSWSEAAQLVYNRLYERIRLVHPSPEQVELFLGRRVPALEGRDWTAASGKVSEMSRHYGGYAFLRRLSSRLKGLPGDITDALIVGNAETLVVNLKTR